ncbi:hypothetical protein NF552_10570 [Roseomonas mucosa]|nr:hypothetical protein NF552_10570 [Roseomonas mucosa]
MTVPAGEASRWRSDAELIEDELRRERARRAALAKLDAEADAAQARADHAADRAAREALAPRHRVLTGSERHRFEMIRDANPNAVAPVDIPHKPTSAVRLRKDEAERARGSSKDFHRAMIRDQAERWRS